MAYELQAGLPQLTKLWKDLVKEEHKPHLPDDDWGVLVTGGSQGVHLLIDIFWMPGRGCIAFAWR
jgi:hypothetical protein